MASEIMIKNMVCPRCIKVVAGILDSLHIRYTNIQLGSVSICDELPADRVQALSYALVADGFELIDDRKVADVERIRLAVIDWARIEGDRPKLSDYLQGKLLKEYSSVSKLFSQMKSMSVERYAVLQRIEYAKEVISYGQMSLSEVASMLGYSSLAHFSGQFKKETGLSPSQFKSLHGNVRNSIDAI